MKTHTKITFDAVKACIDAAKACLDIALSQQVKSGLESKPRISETSLDKEKAIARIRNFISSQRSRFQNLDDWAEIIPHRLGYIKDSNFLVLPAVFREACQGMNTKQVLSVLADRGFIERDGIRFGRRLKIEGKRQTFIVISKDILEISKAKQPPVHSWFLEG